MFVKTVVAGGLIVRAGFFGAKLSDVVGGEKANLGWNGVKPVSDICRRRSDDADSGGDGRAAIFRALIAVKVVTLSGLPVSCAS